MGYVSKQEFGHMLLAIQDLLQYVYEETREERWNCTTSFT